jgi:hypothetical protein
VSGLINLYRESRESGHPGEQQGFVRERFSTALKPPLSLWRPGESAPSEKILIGVASYSVPELRMIDQLAETLAVRGDGAELVQVFDMASVSSMEELQNYLPAIGTVRQTPVVGVWKGTELFETEWGTSAFGWIETHFGINVDRNFRLRADKL